MKKTYLNPTIKTVAVQGPVLMVGGSQTVNSYSKKTITVGDEDPAEVRKNHNSVDWGD